MKSEIYSCCVAIGGDIRSVVHKSTVSVAEILVLQHVHGPDAVTMIKPVGSVTTSTDEQRDELGRAYGDEKIVELFNQFGELPKTLREARIPDTLMDAVHLHESVKKKPQKRAPKATVPVEPEVEEG